MIEQTHRPLRRLFFICLILLIQANLVLAQCDQNIPNFTRLGTYGNSVYYLSNSPSQPVGAESTALAMGGNLVSINSTGENDFIQSMIDEMTYIGLNDANSEGSLTWTSNANVTYTNYDNCGFCNDNDAENDFAIIHPWNGGWSFTNRWSSRRYIVELACSNAGSGSGSGDGGSSEDCLSDISGFQFLGSFENSNYFVSTSTSTWTNANTTAQAQGGSLVVIDDAAENQFLAGKFDEMVYIGLHDASNEGQLSWADGSSLGYENFDGNCGFCNDNDAENDFAIIHPWNAEWSFTNQWSQRRFIMEIGCDEDGGTTPVSTNLSYSNCAQDMTIQLQPNQTRAVVSWTTPTLNNNCTSGISSNTKLSGPNNGSNLTAGNYTVSFRGTNNCGDVATCSFNIEVLESDMGSTNTTLSFGNCPSDRVILIASGESTAFVNWTPPSVSSSCNAGGLSLGLLSGPNNNSNLPAGAYEINYRAVNNCGDVAMCSFTINIMESNSQSSLSIDCSHNFNIQIPEGNTTTAISFVAPIVNNVCDNADANLQQLSGPTRGSQVDAGSYFFQYRATNNCGDVATCEFSINVTDYVPSSLSLECPEDYTILLPAGVTSRALQFSNPDFNSVCNIVDGSFGQISGPARDSLVGVGIYLIEFEGSNNCGDVASCSFTVTVMEDSSPTSISVNCPEDRVLLIPESRTTTTFSSNLPFPGIDNVCPIPGVTTEQIAGAPQGSQVGPGNYMVEYKYTNECNDEAFCSYNIEVIQVPPNTSISVSCLPDLTFTASPGRDSAFVSWDYPIATTDCPAGGATSGQFAGTVRNNEMKEIGNYRVSYRVSNQCGDVELCTFFVSVVSGNNEEGGGTVGYTANDQVTPYTGLFRPGSNVGYNPPWTDEQMADLVAGNPAEGVKGIGAKSMRPGLFESVTAIYGNDFRVNTYDHYESLGLEDLTMIVGFPVEWHKDQTDYCGNGFNSSMFANLYTDIWDDGANGTPYNDDNHYAAYLYEIVSLYGSHVKFWEIWNEPGFDLTGNRGWRQPGDTAGNWWDNDPDPCEYILRAPIEHYVRTLRISWEIIKTLQPDDYVTVAGVGYVSFLDAIMRNTDNPNGGSVTEEYPLMGGAYFDMMGFHSYPDIDGSVYDFNFNTGERVFNRNSDSAAQGIKKTQDSYQVILDKYGYDGAQYPKKEWIITEINVPRVPFRPEAMSGGEEMQVNYIIKAVAVAMQNDVTQMHVYNLGDRTTEANAVTEFDLYGMHKRLTDTNAYTHERHLEAIAYKSAADFVWGSTYDAAKTSQMNLPNNVDGVALSIPNGGHKYIIWAKTTIDQSEFASASYSFPASFGYNQVFSRMWNFTDTDQVNGISSSNINLNGRPIFITETANTNELTQRLSENGNYHLSVADIVPNPAVDEVKLVLESNEADNYVIQIYNVTGQLIEERKTFLERGFNEQRFNISNYVPGMYFVMIEGALMRSTKVKFVKTEK